MKEQEKQKLALTLSIQQSSDSDLINQIREQYANNICLFAAQCITEDPHDPHNPWKPFPIDKIPYLSRLLESFVKEHKIIVLKSRQILATWTFCIAALWRIMFFKGQRGAFVSKKGNDSRRLIERLKFLYEHLPGEYKPLVEFIFFPEPRAVCPETGSKIFAYPQGPNQLRGETFSFIISDEFAFQEFQNETWRASKPTVDGNGTFVAVSTPNGQDNLFYHLWQDPSFHRIEIHYSQNPFKDAKWQQAAFKGLRDKDRQQEYELNFLATSEDTVYGDFNALLHIKPCFFIPNKTLLVGWDFGYNRPGVVYCQYADGIFRVLKSLLGYKTTLDKFIKDAFALETAHFKETGLILDFCDHAGKQTNKQTGLTDIQVLNTLLEPKQRFLRCKPCVSIEDDHKVVRGLMTRLQRGEPCFQVDPSNHQIIGGLRGGYHFKNDEPSGTGINEFFEKEKDYFKHLLDCIRYIVVNNFGVDGPIKITQETLEMPKSRDKRFQFKIGELRNA